MLFILERGNMKNRKILIVDDDKDVLDMVSNIFEIAGYKNVWKVRNGKEALSLIKKDLPDMIISDVMMPEMDGFELLQEIRDNYSIPVLLLTAKNEAEDRFSGFELGADDYLAKPFLPRELLLRVEAIMNRTYKERETVISLSDARIDLKQALVIKGNQEISLTAKEYKILEKLIENKGHIVSVGALCQCACGEFWQGYETSLMTHIRHLREKIEKDPSNPTSIITVKGLGYKLILNKE